MSDRTSKINRSPQAATSCSYSAQRMEMVATEPSGQELIGVIVVRCGASAVQCGLLWCGVVRRGLADVSVGRAHSTRLEPPLTQNSEHSQIGHRIQPPTIFYMENLCLESLLMFLYVLLIPFLGHLAIHSF